MKQRIVITLSLLLEPDPVLADEPTSALDVINQCVSLILLKDMQEKLRNTVVLVSHDIGVQSVITDRIAVMYTGKIVEIDEQGRLVLPSEVRRHLGIKRRRGLMDGRKRDLRLQSCCLAGKNDLHKSAIRM